MSVAVQDFEFVWIREIERRVDENLPIDYRQMMVDLANELPAGFTPDTVNRGLAGNAGATLLGIHVIGDSKGIIADVERAIVFIREGLFADPHLSQVLADDVASVLDIDPRKARRILHLIGQLSSFGAGWTGSTEDGPTGLLIDQDLIVAEYLAFTTIDTVLDEEAARVESWSQAPEAPPTVAPARPEVIDGSVFVLMSMDRSDSSLDDVLNGIKEECAAFGLTARRIDELEHSDTVTSRILSEINSSEFIIADLTGERPNVYYEVGYAHALGKHPILFRRLGTRLHFDLVVHKVPQYENVTDLRAQLRARLGEILGRSPATTRGE